jgi:outer membrane protein assembly factor BamB
VRNLAVRIHYLAQKSIWMTLAAIVLLVSSVCVSASIDAAEENERQIKAAEDVIRSAGFEPTVEGLRKYFDLFLPNDQADRRTRELLQKIGSASFEEREEANRELVNSPYVSSSLLKEAAESGDPEIAWRAKSTLNVALQHRKNVIYSAFRLVHLSKLTGLADRLVLIANEIPSEESGALTQLKLAMMATAGPTDLPLLTQSIEKLPATHQRILIEVLRNRFLSESVATFESYCAENHPAVVRLEATMGLADLGDRRALKKFLALMDSEEAAVRSMADYALRKFTSQNMKYIPYGDVAQRKEGRDRWAAWIDSDGEKAELQFPLANVRTGKSVLNGNTLIAMGYSNKVVELTPDNKVLYELTVPGAWSAEKLESGNVLVAAYSENKVVEMTPSGERVWEVEAPGVLNTRPLENGNILIALYAGNKVVEVNRDKETVWEFQTDSSVADAIRLDNGNTLVCNSSKIIEINPDNTEVWSMEMSQVYGLSVTESGTILASSLSGVVNEIDRESKKVIWDYKTTNPVDAIRLDNGNTLVTANNRVEEVDPEGKLIWHYDGLSYGTARR